MKDRRRDTGRIGEEEACNFLTAKGQTILERNWRGGHVEIDIISVDRDGLHFVEVKSRTAPAPAEPEDNVGFHKQRHLTEAAGRFLNSSDRSGLSDMEIFFDVVTVLFEGDEVKIEYYPQAFIPLYV